MIYKTIPYRTKVFNGIIYEYQSIANLKYGMDDTSSVALNTWMATEQGKFAVEYFQELKCGTTLHIGGNTVATGISAFCRPEDYTLWVLRWK